MTESGEPVTLDDRDEIGDAMAGGVAARTLDAARVHASLQERMFGKQLDTTKVGRFILEHKLGAGGMGIVFAAHDPELDRRIALKVLRSAGNPNEHARLLREARTMAKVRHQNLVTVFEVGTHEDEVFVAMEYVEAGSINAWAKAKQRTWKEILEVYVGAAEGLAAIHAAGLVHRDFKPDNVLIGADGRPQVADFGLAKVADGRGRRPEHELEATDPGRIPVDLATETGTFVGTPAYMAPEQWESGVADPMSDQFSFCVSLYETLYGRRPFEGKTIHMLVEAAASFERVAPTKSPAGPIPIWLRRVMERGLACDPAERYGSMRELVEAIERSRTRARNWRLGLAAVGGSVLSAAIFTFMPEENPCDKVDAAIGENWSRARRTEIGEAFAAVELDLAEETWARIEPRLDAYAGQWRAAKREVCEATLVRHEQSEDAFDLRMRCLDRRRAEFGALIDLFAQADQALVTNAARATDALTALEGCDDVDLLATEKPLPDDPELRESVLQWRALMPGLKALADAGRYADGAKRVDEAFEMISGMEYKPASAEAYYYRGLFALQLGRTKEAIADLEQAFDLALAGGAREMQAQSAGILVHAVGVRAGDPEGARRWMKLARSTAEAWGSRPVMIASLEINIGAVEAMAGNNDEAREHFNRALELYGEMGMSRHPEAANVLMNLGRDARMRGELEEARQRYELAGEIYRETLGPSHPTAGTLHNSLGGLYLLQGNLDAAEVEYRTSLEILRKLLPPTHPSLGHPLNNLGEVLIERGRYDEAVTSFDEATRIWEGAHGKEHPLVAHPLTGRGLARLAQGKVAQARADFERALAIRRNDPPGEDKATTQFGLARALAGESKVRAEEQARLALEGVGQNASKRAEIEAWLAQLASGTL